MAALSQQSPDRLIEQATPCSTISRWNQPGASSSDGTHGEYAGRIGEACDRRTFNLRWALGERLRSE